MRKSFSKGKAGIEPKSRFQRIIENISDPCLMIIGDASDEIILNKSLIRILGYASLLEFKKHASEIIAPSQVFRIKRSIEKRFPKSGKKTRKLILTRNDGTTILCITSIKEFLGVQRKNKTVLLCVVERIIDWSEFQHDKALKNLVKNREILDGTCLILDFEGNILRIKNRLIKIDFRSNSKWGKNNVTDIMTGVDLEKLRIRLTQLKNGHKLPAAEYKLELESDKPGYIRVHSRISYYNKNDVIVTTLKDISCDKEVQNEILKKIIQAEENERARFSNDLHDELGPCLSTIKLSLSNLLNHNDKGNQFKIIKSIEVMLNETIENVKAITWNLAPRNISEKGIAETIKDLVFRLNQLTDVNISFEKVGIEDEYNIQFATAIYRIFLEIINNGIKHANATIMNISINFDPECVSIYYFDDGKGFDLDESLKSSKGIGLRSVMNRINYFQGSIDFYKQKPNGTLIEIHLPIY